jgi:hypothetical protein
LILAALPTCALAQDEASLRAADQAQLVAARAGDADAIAAMIHPNFIINNPLGEAGTGARMIARFRSREIALEQIDRTVERVAITPPVAVVMGGETVRHAPASLEGGGVQRGTIRRRFTHTWLWEGGRWRWLARHASESPKALETQ